MQEVLGAPLSNTWSHILGQLHCGEVVMQCVRDWEGWVEDSVNRREQSFSFLIWTPDRVWEEIRSWRWDLCWRCILRGSKPNGFSSDLSSLWRICWWWWSFQRWALHKLVTCIWTKWYILGPWLDSVVVWALESSCDCHILCKNYWHVVLLPQNYLFHGLGKW